ERAREVGGAVDAGELAGDPHAVVAARVHGQARGVRGEPARLGFDAGHARLDQPDARIRAPGVRVVAGGPRLHATGLRAVATDARVDAGGTLFVPRGAVGVETGARLVRRVV